MIETTATYATVTCDTCNGKKSVNAIDYYRRIHGDQKVIHAIIVESGGHALGWMEENRDAKIGCPKCLGKGIINQLNSLANEPQNLQDNTIIHP